MLGTGLVGRVIDRHAEGAAEKPAAKTGVYRRHAWMAAPAHGQSREAVALAGARPAAEPFHFSARELEILARIAAGATSAEIAEQLHISVHTVKNHRKNIMRKSGCRNSGQLITRCTALGLV